MIEAIKKRWEILPLLAVIIGTFGDFRGTDIFLIIGVGGMYLGWYGWKPAVTVMTILGVLFTFC